jgi:imidazolonepropionase-like amidohydrolase
MWFNGKTFAKANFYSANGVLTQTKPHRVDSTISLEGKFVVPAFGEAHHHGIDGEFMLQEKIDAFLKDGVFYVKNPNVIPELLTPAVRRSINKPSSIDVVFSNGGLTATGGHPVHLHEMLAQHGVFGSMKPEHMENHAYFIVDNAADLEQKWPEIIAGKPDFIKTFLLFSEVFEQRKNSTSQWDKKGLDPAVLKLIVQKAHASNLRVATHVETAADFRNAVHAGVDDIAHLPIPDVAFSKDLSAYVISDSLARYAAQKGVTVVTTVSTYYRTMNGMKRYKDEDKDILLNNQRQNLQRLHKHGVKIALGSDGISGEQPFVTGQSEAMFFQQNRFFDNLTILKLWSETTPQNIFPNRKIGLLKPGYEANFLVLDGNPLIDFNHVKNISLRVKQGVVLELDTKGQNVAVK